MIIAQISDLHIGFDGEHETCKNTERLKIVINALNGLIAKPDIIIATGDLVEHGEVWSYQALKSALKNIDCPVYFALGNHDNREAFKEVFPNILYNDGFLQYTIEENPVRIIVLDTLKHGRHGGSFCEARAAWLEAELARQPERPTIIAMHHPPIDSGIGWLTANPNDGWIQRLRKVLLKYSNVKHIMAGHIHRSIFKQFAQTTVSITQAIAPQTKLELAKIDASVPDGRAMLVESRPGFCLHHWDGNSITTHSAQAPCGKVLFHYDEQFSDIVKHTQDLDH